MLQEIQTIFQVYDDDNSGTLDEEEFVHAMEQIGCSSDDSVAVFKEIDIDGSGEVSFQEFKSWFFENEKHARVILSANDSDGDDDP
jgi:Ca2+-binding EF-hand superfamily protein